MGSKLSCIPHCAFKSDIRRGTKLSVRGLSYVWIIRELDRDREVEHQILIPCYGRVSITTDQTLKSIFLRCQRLDGFRIFDLVQFPCS